MSYFSQNRVRIAQFNVENLFILLDGYQGQDLLSLKEKDWQKLSLSTINPNKPLNQLRQIAVNIREMRPDFLLLCEVGGRESLENFSQLFLNSEYEPYLIEGNSNRGIDIGYLVRRDLPFTYELVSHKNKMIDFLYPHEKLSKDTGYDLGFESHRFSRDVLELRVFEKVGQEDGSSSLATPTKSEPVIIMLLVHLKSQLDRDRIDPGGRDRRKAELEKLVKIYKDLDHEFNGRVPILLAGDFNGGAGLPTPDAEFEALYRDTDLKDVLEIANTPTTDRFTYMQLYNNHRLGMQKQLDYIFVPPALAHRVNHAETSVFRFINELGAKLPIPVTLNEKRLLPSDHYPVILALDPSN